MIRISSVKKFFLLFTFSFLLLPFFGCGYTTRSVISSEYKTISITPFENKIDITRDTDTENKYKITRPMMESTVTRAVSNKYLFDGNLRPVKLASADLVLKGELVEFRNEPLRYSENEEVDEYRVNVVVNISLWNNKTKQLVWEEKNFTGSVSYFPTTTTIASVTTKTESQAISDAINDLARRIVERTVEQW